MSFFLKEVCIENFQWNREKRFPMEPIKMSIRAKAKTVSLLKWRSVGIGFLSKLVPPKGLIALIDQSVVSAANFLTGVIIGRACSKEEFGLYMLGFSLVFFVTTLQTSLISTPYMVYSPRLKGDALAQYTGSTLIHQLVLSASMIVALIVAGVVLSVGVGPQGLAQVVWALAGVITFIMLKEYIRRICFARLQMKTAFVLDFCVSATQISGLLLLANLNIISASLVYWVIGIVCGLSVLCWVVLWRKAITMRINQAISDFKLNWSFGKWVFASRLLWVISMHLYPWILTAFHGTSSTGVWASCLGIVALCNPLLMGVQNYLGPKIAHTFAKNGPITLRRFVFKASTAFLLVVAPFCVILLVFGGMLVTCVYGAKYTGNGLIVFLMAINLLVTAGTFSFSRALFAMERADLDFAANILALIVLITLSIWLVRSFGPLGAAYGLLISNVLASSFRCAAFVRLTGFMRKAN